MSVPLAHHLDGLARAAAESALRFLGLAGHVEEAAPFRFALAMACGFCSSKICTITESVSVKSSLIFGKSLLMWR